MPAGCPSSGPPAACASFVEPTSCITSPIAGNSAAARGAAVSEITRITRTTPFDDLPALMRVEEASRWLGVSKGLIYAMAQRGDLASVRLGRLLRIRREALAANASEGAR